MTAPVHNSTRTVRIKRSPDHRLVVLEQHEAADVVDPEVDPGGDAGHHRVGGELRVAREGDLDVAG